MTEQLSMHACTSELSWLATGLGVRKVLWVPGPASYCLRNHRSMMGISELNFLTSKMGVSSAIR